MRSLTMLLDSSRGQFIPRDFVTDGYFALDADHCCAWHVRHEDALVLAAGPYDSEHYWETWNYVLDNAYYVDAVGNRLVLHQDGDLWAGTPEAIAEVFGEP